jgi:hypothetical protein
MDFNFQASKIGAIMFHPDIAELAGLTHCNQAQQRLSQMLFALRNGSFYASSYVFFQWILIIIMLQKFCDDLKFSKTALRYERYYDIIDFGRLSLNG